MLHDVGKIGIPDKVLLNPGQLSDADWEMMRAHPELGLGIVEPIRLPKTVKTVFYIIRKPTMAAAIRRDFMEKKFHSSRES